MPPPLWHPPKAIVTGILHSGCLPLLGKQGVTLINNLFTGTLPHY